MKTVAIYARYSTDLQNERSIADQINVCKDRVQREGWKVFDDYSDYALSGASMRRPGLQRMLQDARDGNFNVVLVEALDRLSRDQADIAAIYKRLQFCGVEIITLSEGRVGDRDVALLGMINHHYRVENANKIRRGLISRIKEGKVLGNISYGYRVVRRLDVKGEPIRGERRIEKKEADTIRRIFRNYADGQSPHKIARQLNTEGVAGPGGRVWNPSAISGERSRGIGILNNELYVGRRVWNCVTYAYDPETGKKVIRYNPPELWVKNEVPSLRIVDQRLWERVRNRQQKLSRLERRASAASVKPRSNHLLLGIARCGVCGGRWEIKPRGLSGCWAHNHRGTCKNHLRISRFTLEAMVLQALKDRLGNDPLLCVALCAGYARRLIEFDEQRQTKIDAYQNELKRIEVQRGQALQERKKGHAKTDNTANLSVLKVRQQAVEQEIARAMASCPDPGVVKTYLGHVDALVQTFNRNIQQAETEALRSLIRSVVLRPNKDRSDLTVEIEQARPSAANEGQVS